MFNHKGKKLEQLNRNQRLGASMITAVKPNHPISEAFRTMRTNIEFSMVDGTLNSLMLTSTGPFEGKSTVAANLASVMADTGKRVLLVDADMRKPTVRNTFNLKTNYGLTNLLTQNEAQTMDMIRYVPEANVYVLAAGPKPPNPSELLQSNKMNDLMKTLETMFDLVIYDAPPLLSVADSQILSRKVDGVVFVAREGIAERPNITKAKDLLDAAEANILGVVFNGVSKEHTGYGYGYGYGYGHEED